MARNFLDSILNYQNPETEDDQGLAPIPFALSQPPPQAPLPIMPKMSQSKPAPMMSNDDELTLENYKPQEMNPEVKQYIAKKYGLTEEVNADAYKAAEERVKERDPSATTEFIAGIGAAIAGRDPSGVSKTFDNIRAGNRDKEIGSLDRKRKAQIEDMQVQRQSDLYDPASAQSQAFRSAISSQFPRIAEAYGDTWNNVSAADKDLLFEPLKLREQMDARKETARILSANREEQRADRDMYRNYQMQEKQERDLRERDTQYGVARTNDDAKKLKDAGETKQKFDAQLSELIGLREKYGSEVANRDVVARSKQLSKDLLLGYKELAKLGVLSQADEAILNEIIPSDPTQFSMSQMFGQDPTLTKLKAFKADTEQEFKNRLQNRLDPKFMSKEPPQSSETVNVQSPDGRVRKIPKSKLQDAIQAGGKLVE